MGPFGLFASGRNARLVADLSAELAVRSHDGVWVLVQERARSMSPAEARGYARARARQTVERQAQLVLRGYPETSASIRERIVATGLEQLVSTVMRELLSLPARTRFRQRAA